MKYHTWDYEKNELLKNERGISFEDILYHIETGCLLAVIEHPNRDKYPNQKMYIVNIDNYAYLVPFVEDDEHVFLKTIIPSRKATRRYLKEDGT
jgi:uncharacterized DUF497 family protein